MTDIVSQIVLAIGDVDLLSEYPIGTVANRFGARLECIQVGTCLRLGQVHRTHPFAGDEFFQIGVLQFLRTMLFQRFDRADRQQRTQSECHGSRVPHFCGSHRHHHRKPLAAELLWPGNRIPSALAPGLVGFLPAGRRGDFGVFQRRSMRIAYLVERGDFFCRKAASLLEDGIDQIFGKVAEGCIIQRLFQPGYMFQCECDFRNRSTIHAIFPCVLPGMRNETDKCFLRKRQF